MHIKISFRLFFTVGFLLLTVLSLSARKSSVTVLLLDIKNQSKDTQYDYMENLIKAILQFDFATVRQLKLIDKATLEEAIQEQELLQSKLNLEQAIELATSLEAEYLITGKYEMIAEEEERKALATSPELDIVDLGLDTRTEKVLAGAGLITVGELLDKLAQGDEGLTNLKGFGLKSLATLKKTLRSRGFTLPGDEAPEQVEEAEPEEAEAAE